MGALKGRPYKTKDSVGAQSWRHDIDGMQKRRR
jgi:hypothetical protein